MLTFQKQYSLKLMNVLFATAVERSVSHITFWYAYHNMRIAIEGPKLNSRTEKFNCCLDIISIVS